ncbi:aminotransferase-like domain-containing protein [Streptomyces sp. NBC_01304]|uniref:aminotransferase-like domain-containing protein n=1 Tax=Streptomyces sp. NBC_01304 TaxID=2903818 RepID=UPI002E139598|nr:aminotransferase class I/II-fold pyridoxal phosphate-dependent enzyme [Streptomyces sp. NBC_01304]
MARAGIGGAGAEARSGVVGSAAGSRTQAGTAGNAPPGAADFLQLRTTDAPAGGLADWLARELRAAIADGRLPVGTRLPASRVLAGELRVSRGVVTEAYRRLGEDGQVAGHGRGGTVVLAAPVAAWDDATHTRPAAPAPGGRRHIQPTTPARHTAGHTQRTTPARDNTRHARPTTPARHSAERAQPASRAPAFAPTPGLDVFDAIRAAPARMDLTPGLPDLAAFPRASWLRAERAVLAGLAPADFGYGDPRGTPALRQAIVHWLARNRGIRAEPDELIVTSGTAQTLSLVAQVLRAEGISALAVEEPSSLGARQHLHNWQLDTPPVPVDADGLRVDVLRATGASAVLLTPAHQFPMGVVLAGERRRELLAWAAESNGLIIEDDYDAEHRYDRPPVAALRSLLPDQVLYAGSVSKILAPALRIGWMLPPPRHRDALVEAKRFADLGNAALPQLVLAHFLASGAMERHLRLSRARHRRRRDTMIAALGRYLPDATVHGAAAGLHLTVTYDSGRTDTEVAAGALERGVKAHPLSWHAQLPGTQGLVLGYAAAHPSAITEGVAVLGDLLRGA